MSQDLKKQIDSAVQELTSRIGDHVSETEKRAKRAERKLKTADNRLARETQKRRDQVAELRKRERTLNRESRRLAAELEKLDSRVAAVNEERDRLASRSEALTYHVRRLTDDHHASTDLFERAHQELRRRHRLVKDVRADADAKLSAALAERDEFEARLAASEKALAKANEKRRATLGECRQLRRDVKTRRAALEETGREKERLEAELGALTAEHDRTTAELVALRAELDAARKLSREQAAQAAEAGEVTQALRRELGEVRKQLADEKKRREAVGKRTGLRNAFRRRPERLAPPLPPGQPVTERSGEGPAAGTGWFVRAEDGTLYGPAPLEIIKSWACDCRIGPTHEVSKNGQSWKRSFEWDELEMTETVTLADGRRYGPIHPDAVPHITGAEAR